MMRTMKGTRIVLLLGCVKLKHERRAAAKDLYRSPLWVRRRAFAEASGHQWLILSAKHGLVDPDKRLEPGDLALGDLGAADRRSWGERVARTLERRFGSVDGITFEVHAGEAYRRAIEPGVAIRGGRIVVPLAGLQLGEQLSWYRVRAASAALGGEPAARRHTCTSAEVRRALAALDGAPNRIAAREWPAGLTDVTQPGLYSWWVDDTGATLLSGGLRHAVSPGRIYAGQTGATRWPSGKAGKATLASRIGANQLRGHIRGSTFRLTLASCLAEPLGLTRIDAQHLSSDSEQQLSAWMCEHLQIAVLPFPERDPLADLEHRVLAKLDPPLNIEGMPPTPLRRSLSLIRAGRV
jgi:hypothetical protein